MERKRTLRGFTLSELVIGLVLFSIVMAVSGAAISAVMSLLHRETDRTLSSVRGSGICSYLSEEVRYALNIDITASLYSEDGRYDIYSVEEGSLDVILYVADGVIYMVDGIDAGGTVSKSVLYEMTDADISLVCRPDISSETLCMELTAVKRGRGERVLGKTAAVRRLNRHIGHFRAENGLTEFTDNYYICIDNDGR